MLIHKFEGLGFFRQRALGENFYRNPRGISGKRNKYLRSLITQHKIEACFFIRKIFLVI